MHFHNIFCSDKSVTLYGQNRHLKMFTKHYVLCSQTLHHIFDGRQIEFFLFFEHINSVVRFFKKRLQCSEILLTDTIDKCCEMSASYRGRVLIFNKNLFIDLFWSFGFCIDDVDVGCAKVLSDLDIEIIRDGS